MFVLLLLSVKKDLLGPLYVSLFHPIHMSQLSQKRSGPVRAHVQHKSAFIDCLVSQGPVLGLGMQKKMTELLGEATLVTLPWYKV